MTAVSVPKFIVSLMENEIVTVVNRTIDAVARCTNVPIDRLVREVEKEFDMKVRIIPLDEEEVRIIKIRNRKIVPDECRCIAQIKKDGLLKQCSFTKCKQSDYCTRHSKKYANKDIVSEEKQPQRVQKLRKIY